MKDAARFVEIQTSIRPKVGVVLGSGLGAFADTIANSVRLPYEDIPGFPKATAIGHAGELVAGVLGVNGKIIGDVIVMSGRFHLYEGYSAREATVGMRLFRELGVERVVLTNAAGGINPAYSKGSLVSISDHINLQGTNPLVGPNDENLGPRFPDMTEAYCPKLRLTARQTAEHLGITLHEGVYAGLLGPSYETPAEIRYLETIGADLVGMSTVAETIVANHMGMKVLAISCVTNMAAGILPQKIDHQEVLEAGRRVRGTLSRLLRAVIPALAAEAE